MALRRRGTAGGKMERAGTVFTLEVNPKIPKRLARLAEPADRRWYSSDRHARSLFARLHPALWDAVGHSPKVLLKRVGEDRLEPGGPGPAERASHSTGC